MKIISKMQEVYSVNDTSFLRFVAILLIFNSHLESYYPYSWLAGGGLLGNSIFFFVSGVGLSASISDKSQRFFDWYIRRLLRIYPTVFMATFIYMCVTFFRSGTFQFHFDGNVAIFLSILIEGLKLFVWPTMFYFVAFIVIFYILIYFVADFFRKYPLLLMGYALIIVVLFSGLHFKNTIPMSAESLYPNWFFGIYYFFIMNLAVYLSGRICENWRKPCLLAIVVLLSFLSYIGFKILTLMHVVDDIYFGMVFVSIIVFCYSSHILFTNRVFVNELNQIKFLWYPVKFISIITLEIYVFHEICVLYFGISLILFPLNILVAFSISLLFSFVMYCLMVKLKNVYQ